MNQTISEESRRLAWRFYDLGPGQELETLVGGIAARQQQKGFEAALPTVYRYSKDDTFRHAAFTGDGAWLFQQALERKYPFPLTSARADLIARWRGMPKPAVENSFMKGFGQGWWMMVEELLHNPLESSVIGLGMTGGLLGLGLLAFPLFRGVVKFNFKNLMALGSALGGVGLSASQGYAAYNSFHQGKFYDAGMASAHAVQGLMMMFGGGLAAFRAVRPPVKAMDPALVRPYEIAFLELSKLLKWSDLEGFTGGLVRVKVQDRLVPASLFKSSLQDRRFVLLKNRQEGTYAFAPYQRRMKIPVALQPVRILRARDAHPVEMRLTLAQLEKVVPGLVERLDVDVSLSLGDQHFVATTVRLEGGKCIPLFFHRGTRQLTLNPDFVGLETVPRVFNPVQVLRTARAEGTMITRLPRPSQRSSQRIVTFADLQQADPEMASFVTGWRVKTKDIFGGVTQEREASVLYKPLERKRYVLVMSGKPDYMRMPISKLEGPHKIEPGFQSVVVDEAPSMTIIETAEGFYRRGEGPNYRALDGTGSLDVSALEGLLQRNPKAAALVHDGERFEIWGGGGGVWKSTEGESLFRPGRGIPKSPRLIEVVMVSRDEIPGVVKSGLSLQTDVTTRVLVDGVSVETSVGYLGPQKTRFVLSRGPEGNIVRHNVSSLARLGEENLPVLPAGHVPVLLKVNLPTTPELPYMRQIGPLRMTRAQWREAAPDFTLGSNLKKDQVWYGHRQVDITNQSGTFLVQNVRNRRFGTLVKSDLVRHEGVPILPDGMRPVYIGRKEVPPHYTLAEGVRLWDQCPVPPDGVVVNQTGALIPSSVVSGGVRGSEIAGGATLQLADSRSIYWCSDWEGQKMGWSLSPHRFFPFVG